MLEIDCRKCQNLAATKDSCKLYGSDVKKAVAACRRDLFMHYNPTPERLPLTGPAKPGETVWIIVRDENTEAVEVAGYVYLARVAGMVIVSPKINDYDLEGIMAYHCEQTQEDEYTALYVFPDEDVYNQKANALSDFHKEAGEV